MSNKNELLKMDDSMKSMGNQNTNPKKAFKQVNKVIYLEKPVQMTEEEEYEIVVTSESQKKQPKKQEKNFGIGRTRKRRVRRRNQIKRV